MRTWISERARPLSVVVAVLVLAAAAGIAYVVTHDTAMKKGRAFFPSTIGIYKGSSVRLLGVPVGDVTNVKPEGTIVEVDFEYKASTQLPQDVGMQQIPPSIVSDRYLQFTPTYSGGPQYDGRDIPASRTQVPVELDQIFGSLNDLNVALGPNGANKTGALAQLIDVGAANLQGNGALFNSTLKGFASAINALSDSRDALFGTITSLQKFTTTLANDDTGVRTINQQLATVTGQLAGERTDLGAALANLATALTQIQSFVADNKDILTHDVATLTSVTSGIVSEKTAITEVLDEAPPALHNLALSYDPTATTCSNVDPSQCSMGALSTRADNSGDPSALACTLVVGALSGPTGADLSALTSACQTVLAGGSSSSSSTAKSSGSTPPKGTSSAPTTGLPSVPSVPLPTATPSTPVGGLLGGILGGGSGSSVPSTGSTGGSTGSDGGLGSILTGGIG